MMNQTNNQSNHNKIVINLQSQILNLYECSNNNEKLQKQYQISSGKNGIGCLEGTGQTPIGKHIIAQKIGENQPINSVFVGRVPTGEVYSNELARRSPNRDWILSRILWLSGLDEGVNKGTNQQGLCDTYQRYIYIHGTPDTEPMGEPMSHGCIRMRNTDIIELFTLVNEGTGVSIEA